MSNSTYFLNSRVLVYPTADKPVSISSIQGKGFDAIAFLDPAQRETIISGLREENTRLFEKVMENLSKQRRMKSQTEEVITADHLQKIVDNLRNGSIKQDSVTFENKDGSVTLHIDLVRS